jgi:phage/conjugal plasmid C-4 type zinc finger TraR family protein
MMAGPDDYQYNNEEEAEIAQLNSIHMHLNAIEEVRKKIPKGPSLEECEDCGEEIPEARRLAQQGITRCIYCQGLFERKQKGY